MVEDKIFYENRHKCPLKLEIYGGTLLCKLDQKICIKEHCPVVFWIDIIGDMLYEYDRTE